MSGGHGAGGNESSGVQVTKKKSASYQFMCGYLERVGARQETREVILEAYEWGYEKYSDGVTLVSDWEFEKHPLGVGHDWLYYTGRMPRRKADLWFKRGLEDFGHPLLARIRYFALRVGGWFAWRGHRKAGHSFEEYKRKHGRS